MQPTPDVTLPGNRRLYRHRRCTSTPSLCSPICSPPVTLVLFLLAFCFVPILVSAETHRDDLIGFYTLHPLSHQIASNKSCPLSLETTTYDFAINNAPLLVTSPSQFNIRIPHATTLANNNHCTAGTNFIAVTSDHPFVEDPRAAVDAWANAGNANGKFLPWLAPDIDELVPIVSSSSWIVAYDFSDRICKDVRISAHAAYLYFQPPIPFNLSNVPLSTKDKYLALAFGGGKRNRACLYVAQKVGGDAPYGFGPVSDPSENVTHPVRPVPHYNSSIPLPSGIVLPSGFASPTPSSSPSTSQSPSPSPVLVTQETVEVTPTPMGVFGNIENDPDGPLGAVVDSSVRSSCFSRSNSVTLSDASSIPIDNLQSGHSVQVGPARSQFSTVFFFSHRVSNELRTFPFLNISFSSDFSPSYIVISADHYLHARASAEGSVALLAASELNPGSHSLLLKDGSLAPVLTVRNVYDTGLYAPHTLHGDIVINNVVVSTYTASIHPKLAHHVLLRPVAWLHRLGLVQLIQPFFTQYSEFVYQFLIPLIPSGPRQLSSFTQ